MADVLEIALAAGVPLATGVTVPVTLAVALGVEAVGTAVGVPSAPNVGSAGAKTGVAEASD